MAKNNETPGVEVINKSTNVSDLDPQPRVGNFSSSFFVSSASGSSSSPASMTYENPIEVANNEDKPAVGRGRKSGRGSKKAVREQAPPTREESFQDEEYGGISRLNEETDENAGIVCQSSWFEKHKRCWIGLAIVLFALVASIASATATAIGMAVGMSNNNNVNTVPAASIITAPGSETGGAPRCSTVRCGSSWADANEKCGTRCGASWLESAAGDSNGSTTASSCPAGESCFSDLNPVLDCCRDEDSENPEQGGEEEEEGEEGEEEPGIASPTPTGPQCAEVRCGTSWIDANTKCGAQCLTQACPNGEACWADLDPSLECCPETLDSQKPLFNVQPQDSVCSAMRCGVSWEDANNKCGDSCGQVPEEDACPSGETCYQGLDTNSAWCSSASRCGSSWNEANGKCGQSCSIPTCPAGESCYADLSTSTLECCFPEPEPVECTTTRCGLTWANANNYCLPNCESDADCTGDLQRCYADLTTDLDCCLETTNDEMTSGNIMDELDATCTTTRCGLSWGSANTNCGANCVDNGDCTEQGHTCFADLTADLDCCGVA